MKKVFVVSLLLVSIFLIGNAEVALANGDCQDYECTYISTCDGEFDGGGKQCVELCTDGFFYGDIGAYWFDCDLLALNHKSWLGEGGSMGGDIGCSVNLSGRAMTLVISLTEVDCIERNTCVPCDDCCMPPAP